MVTTNMYADTRDRSSIRRPGDPRGGNALVEFALVFIPFLVILLAIFDFSFALYTRGALHNAVREGVRYAITAQTSGGLGHDQSIKNVVRLNSAGVLSVADEALIGINYFLPSCSSGCATMNNGPGNLVIVSVDDYEIPVVGPLSGLGANGPLNITVSAVDKMEPYTGAPPTR